MKEIRTVRGVNDLLPGNMDKHIKIKEVGSKTCKLFCYEEIDTPIFEFTEVFNVVGTNCDIINKETYTFFDRGGDSITLRPEGTAAIASIEKGSSDSGHR